MASNTPQITMLLDKMSKLLGTEFTTAISQITSNAQIAKLTAAVSTGDINKVMHAAGMRAGSWNGLTEQIRAGYHEGGIFSIDASVPSKFGMVFDISNPRAEQFLRFQSSRLIKRINKEQRYAIQLILKEGLKLGRNPKSVGLDIVGRMGRTSSGVYKRVGGVIGLNGPQTKTVLKARNELNWVHTTKPGESNYFTRTRRDRRFDKVVHKAVKTGKPLSAATVSKLTGRYSDRLKELRGATIGRTEMLRSLNAAANESMLQVVDEKLAPKEAIKRIWHHSYSKGERAGHLAMGKDLQERPMDEAFVNPYTKNTMMYPGEGTASEVINCRCWVEHEVDYVQVESGGAIGGEPPPLPGLQSMEDTKKAVAALRAARLAKTAAREAAAKKSAAQRAAKEATAKKAAAKAKKKSFNKDGSTPKFLPWVNKFRKAGAFDTPRLKKITSNITDPKQIKILKEGAHYDPQKRGINMTGHYGNTEVDRSVMRHEWGHFFDDQIGQLLKQADHYLNKRLKNLAGNYQHGFRYMSSMDKPVKALASDAQKLNKLGARVYRKNKDSFKTKPLDSKDLKTYGDPIYSQEIIEEGWHERKMHFGMKYGSNEAVEAAKIPARKLLNESDHLVAKVYREVVAQGGALGPWDELMLLDAVQANDLSILFYRNGDFMKMMLSKPSQADVFAGFSDLMGATTGENGFGGWALGPGHGPAHYTGHWKVHRQATESFANLTSLESERAVNKLFNEIIGTLSPKYSNWYDRLLDLLNSQL
jgi:hypothetical protein